MQQIKDWIDSVDESEDLKKSFFQGFLKKVDERPKYQYREEPRVRGAIYDNEGSEGQKKGIFDGFPNIRFERPRWRECGCHTVQASK